MKGSVGWGLNGRRRTGRAVSGKRWGAGGHVVFGVLSLGFSILRVCGRGGQDYGIVCVSSLFPQRHSPTLTVATGADAQEARGRAKVREGREGNGPGG